MSRFFEYEEPSYRVEEVSARRTRRSRNSEPDIFTFQYNPRTGGFQVQNGTILQQSIQVMAPDGQIYTITRDANGLYQTEGGIRLSFH